MAQKFRRHTLKSKDTKALLSEVSKRLKIDLEKVMGHKVNFEIVKTNAAKIILIDGKPLLFKVDDKVFPTLYFKEFVERLPKIVVDMGAVPYVCKGADIMAPGVENVEGEFCKGDIVVVVDIKYRKPLALGESINDFDIVKSAKKGPVAKNVHFVSDKIWDLSKLLSV